LHFIGKQSGILNPFVQGLTLSVGSILTIISSFLLHSSVFMKRKEIEDKDERLQKINAEASARVFTLNIIIMSLLIFIFGWLGEEYLLLCIVLAALVGVNALLALCFRSYLSKKY
jgi:Na+/H+ antiporter NhaD/arsenite permease-like protein